MAKRNSWGNQKRYISIKNSAGKLFYFRIPIEYTVGNVGGYSVALKNICRDSGSTQAVRAKLSIEINSRHLRVLLSGRKVWISIGKQFGFRENLEKYVAAVWHSKAMHGFR
jgi:hypothetical protein